MASNERKRQEKLARKAAKRKQHHDTIRRSAAETSQTMSLHGQLALAAHAPLHECLVPQRLFEEGMGNIFVSRRLPNGNMVAAGFLLDVWCLGVKNAFLKVATAYEYSSLVGSLAESQRLRPCDPACARKLVEEAEAYAADLGFSPHPDYADARRIFGDIDKSACRTQFRFGKDGKPFFASGPYDTPAKSRRIVDTLTQRCGPDGFHAMVALGGPPPDLFALPDEEELDEEEDPGEDDRSLGEGEARGAQSRLARLRPFRR